MTARQLRVLESVAHLEHTKPNSYAHQVLVEHLASMAKNPRVKADLENRAAYDADAASTTKLRGSRGTPAASRKAARKRTS
jgi:hypothetical protein